MGELIKAKLQEVRADEHQTPEGEAVPVQFNPESLKLRLQNQTDGGRSRGRQRRQHNGSSSTSLSMDLVFDTADEGTDEAPVSVRTRTAIVEKYVLPKENTSDAPPLLQFQWDQLIITGVVESVDIEFDHFAANGAPLRAKVSLSIKEQDPKYTYVNPDERNSSGSEPAGTGDNSAAAPGSGTNEDNNSGDANERTDTALDGETAPEFLARQGLDPSAWRGLGVDLSAGLSLEAGIEVGFSASLSASLGVGVSVGVLAKAGVSLEASLGIGASAVFSAGAGVSVGTTGGEAAGKSTGKKIDGDSAGLAISAAGGIQSAVETLKIRETASAAGAAQSAFGLAVSPTAGIQSVQMGPAISRTPLSRAAPSAVPAGGVAQLPRSPKADPRSTSYGYGVPLRALYPTALSQEEITVCGPSGRAGGGDAGPQFRKQKTTPPWEALPKRESARSLADGAESNRRRGVCGQLHKPCGCH